MQNKFNALALLIFISSLGQVMSDLYLPSMAAIIKTFATSHHTVQLSLSLFMYGLAISQLCYGIISDAVGRKKPLIAGIILCLVGSLVCTLAHTIQIFIFGRFLQGFGAGSGIALSRSIMRDVFAEPLEYARTGSYLTIVMVILVMIAPLLGGYIQNYLGWRVSFLILSGYAAWVFILVSLFLPETSQHYHLNNLKLRSIAENFLNIISNQLFIGYMACIFLVYAGILGWLTLGPILLVKEWGLSPIVFGWVSGVIGLFYILGCFLNAKLIKHTGINFMLSVGIYLMLASGILLLILISCEVINFYSLIFLVGIFFIAGSFIFANAGAGALSSFKLIAGTAGALAGFIQIIGGAVASTLMATQSSHSALPLSYLFIICGLGSLLGLTIAKRAPDLISGVKIQ